MRLDEAFAHIESLRRELGETFVTAARRRFLTQLIRSRSQHLSVSVADRNVLMKRVDNAGAGERPARLENHVVAEIKRVLEMDNIRFVGLEKSLVMLGEDLLATRFS